MVGIKMIASEKPKIKDLGTDNWLTERLSPVPVLLDGTQALVTSGPPLTPHPVGAFCRRLFLCTHPIPQLCVCGGGGAQVHGSAMDSGPSWGSNSQCPPDPYGFASSAVRWNNAQENR